MKNTEEILFVKGVFNELDKANLTGLSKLIQDCMKEYASQFIDEAANKYIPDDNPKIFRDKILKLKQDLK